MKIYLFNYNGNTYKTLMIKTKERFRPLILYIIEELFLFITIRNKIRRSIWYNKIKDYFKRKGMLIACYKYALDNGDYDEIEMFYKLSLEERNRKKRDKELSKFSIRNRKKQNKFLVFLFG